MRFIAILLALLPNLALAQNTAQIDGDFTGDGRADRAVLTQTTIGGQADLLLYIRQPDDSLILQTTATKLAWVGGMAGQKPQLEISQQGSLLVHMMNASIGRDRWHETLIIAWRGNRFMLAGYSNRWFDTVDNESNRTCDVNLLTGKGGRTRGTFLREIAFMTETRSAPIGEWDREPPKECIPNN